MNSMKKAAGRAGAGGSDEEDSQREKKRRRTRPSAEEDVSLSFPQRLMEVLDEESYCDIVSWLGSGRSFMIHNREKFASKILPKHFNKASKFASFARKLNRWGFARVEKGPEAGAYYNPNFFKGGHRQLSQLSCRSSGPNVSAPSSFMHPDHEQNPGNVLPAASNDNNLANVASSSLVAATDLASDQHTRAALLQLLHQQQLQQALMGPQLQVPQVASHTASAQALPPAAPSLLGQQDPSVLQQLLAHQIQQQGPIQAPSELTPLVPGSSSISSVGNALSAPQRPPQLTPQPSIMVEGGRQPPPNSSNPSEAVAAMVAIQLLQQQQQQQQPSSSGCCVSGHGDGGVVAAALDSSPSFLPPAPSLPQVAAPVSSPPLHQQATTTRHINANNAQQQLEQLAQHQLLLAQAQQLQAIRGGSNTNTDASTTLVDESILSSILRQQAEAIQQQQPHTPSEGGLGVAAPVATPGRRQDSDSSESEDRKPAAHK